MRLPMQRASACEDYINQRVAERPPATLDAADAIAASDMRDAAERCFFLLSIFHTPPRSATPDCTRDAAAMRMAQPPPRR